MEYTVTKLSRAAGISARTLRYYHKIGLLAPARVNESGYRLYGPAQVDRLQQILFYRELGFPLTTIASILTDPAFDKIQALHVHRTQLTKERNRLSTLIRNVDKTIQATKGNIIMSDKEKFEGFKQDLINENEKKYGKESRSQYGDDAINRSNEKVKNMTKQQHEEVTILSKTLMEKLAQAKAQGDPKGLLAQEVADLHRKWLCFYWPEYSKQAHAALAQMYVDDERFTAYYDKESPGTAKFLRDALLVYTGLDG